MGDIVFGAFPAKKHLSPIEQRWEIDESALYILQLNFARMKFPNQIVEPAEVAHKHVRCRAAEILARSQSGSEELLRFVNAGAHSVHLRKPSANGGEHFTGFGWSVVV